MNLIRPIILASSSPRRRELLEQVGIPFEVDTSDADETMGDGIKPPDYVEELSRRKAESVAIRHPHEVILGADTIVAFDDKILGKPADVDEAYGMLCMLAGRTHSVYTGVTLIFPQGADGQERDMETFHVKTDVKMYDSDKQILREYAKSGEPLDKAGAYGIQGRGAILVEKIDGDYSNVKGLPVAEVYRRLYHNFPSSGQAISTTFSII